MSKCIIAMSGGVDSAVAAYLMKNSGHECIGITMKLFDNADINLSKAHTCCSLDDVQDARSVAYSLGMPHYVFNFADRFRETVINKFVESYENASTPNPCIDCNKYLKFDKLYSRAKELDYNYVVTGHYAVVEYSEKVNRYILKKSHDPRKDQTYVLWTLTQEQLAHTYFPLGTLTKSEVRKIAEENGFINAKKHDSQDICFVPDGKYAEFIEKYRGKKYPEGNFIDTEGNLIGKHRGIIHYTLGQRRGLGISSDGRLYVCRIDPEHNAVTLGKEEDLYSTTLTASNINLISVPRLDKPTRLELKVRYSQNGAMATVTQTGDDMITAVFDTPQRAITRGQSVVMYDGDVVVGGGIISGSY
ncbi:MAG: tRNA 2-thiouridine(34) synthase MnmA [Clostridia bacterium]|nr:tRNA 2-thiouridine(34) synthase MnmA [Clostridia bacterium]